MLNIAKPRFGLKVSIGLIVAWIVIAVTIAFLLGTINWLDYYRLASRGVPIDGFVTGKEPSNHLAVYYNYSIGSKTYAGVGHAASSEALQTMNIGDKLRIHYLSQDPHISCWGDPQRLLVNETLPVLLAILTFPTVIVSVVYLRFRRWSSISPNGLLIWVLVGCSIFLSCSVDAHRQAATIAVESFHTKLDAEDYSGIYLNADDQFRLSGSENELTSFLAKVHRALGTLRKTKQTQSKVGYLEGIGTQVILVYDSDFEKGRGVEQFLWQMRDGKALLVRYDISSSLLQD